MMEEVTGVAVASVRWKRALMTGHVPFFVPLSKTGGGRTTSVGELRLAIVLRMCASGDGEVGIPKFKACQSITPYKRQPRTSHR